MLVASNTRAAKLKRMARTLNLRYDNQVDSVLSPDSSAQAQFFKQGLHQFYHVLTFRDPGSFVRVCEDRIFSSPLDKKPLQAYTLVTAELTKDTFPSFVLKPRKSEQADSHPLPADLATRYTLSAPEGFSLPSMVISFLKAHPLCYVECTETALIYCEFSNASMEQLQPLRFRALQLIKDLVKKEDVKQVEEGTPKPQLTDEQLQAQILLKLQTASPRTPRATASNTHYIYGLILLVFLSAMMFLTWYALHNWVAK